MHISLKKKKTKIHHSLMLLLTWCIFVAVVWFAFQNAFFFCFLFSLHLLSFLSQFDTFTFQSHVCFSMSKAKPEGHVICLSPDRVHLQDVLGLDFRLIIWEKKIVGLVCCVLLCCFVFMCLYVYFVMSSWFNYCNVFFFFIWFNFCRNIVKKWYWKKKII